MSDRQNAMASPGPRCPICGRPTDEAIRPFCSRRCADVDLARWMTGAYAVPAAEEDDPDAAEIEGRSRTDDERGA